MRIFLSHDTADSRTAEALTSALKARLEGCEVFAAHRGLHYGAQQQLPEHIEPADVLIILLGSKVGSWQLAEYYSAQNRAAVQPGFRILAVLMTDGARALPFLSSAQYVKAPDPAAEPYLSEILAALRDEARAIPVRQMWKSVCPYRGFEALREEDADFFFGREEDTATALSLLASRESGIVTLIGSSGVGKSSLVEAGVFAALRRQVMPNGAPWPAELADSRGWLTLTMRPGEDPLQSLAAAFMDQWFGGMADPERVNRRNAWAALFREGRSQITDIVQATYDRFERELGLPAPRRILLNIDQAEELYSLAPESARELFSRLVAQALADRRFAVIASLRSDYYGHHQANTPLFANMQRLDVRPLGTDGLKRAITAPAEALGVSFESSEFEDRAVQGTGGKPAALALGAYYLTALWEQMRKRGDGVLRPAEEAALQNAGEAPGALADLFAAEHAAEGETLRRLFTYKLAKVQKVGRAVRRRVARTELSPAEWQLIEAMAERRWRLIATDYHGLDAAYAEIAHDVLLECWGTLSAWLDGERGFLACKARTEDAKEVWRKAARDKRLLLAGGDLIQAGQWLALREGDFDAESAEFIRGSLAARDAAAAAALRMRHRLQWGSAAAVAVAMTAAALVAGMQWQNAESGKTRAEQAYAHAQKALQAAAKASDSLVLDLVRKLKGAPAPQAQIVGQILNRARELTGELANGGALTPSLEESRVDALTDSVDYLLAAGSVQDALANARESAAIMERLTAFQPSNTEWLHSLSISYEKTGDALIAGGSRETALEFYKKELAIAEKLAKAGEGRSEWQRSLSIGYEKVGDALAGTGGREDALGYYRQSLAIREKLASAGGGSEESERDLAASYQRLGEALTVKGNRDAALDYYKKLLPITDRLVKSGEQRPAWQHGFADNYGKVGDALSGAGDHEGALACYKKSLAIAEKLALSGEGRTEWQRSLAAIYEKNGDALSAKGNSMAALEYYKKSVAIAEKLAQPGAAPATRHDLAIIYNKAGDALAAQSDRDGALEFYKKSVAIAEKLANAEEGRLDWQRDLSAGYIKAGDALIAVGDHDAALDYYKKELVIAEKLAKSDEGRVEWQAALAASYQRAGDALSADGDHDAALDYYQKQLAIAEKLAKSDELRTEWQFALAGAYEKTGDALKSSGDRKAALDYYKKDLAIAEKLANSGQARPEWQHALAAAYERFGDAMKDAGDRKAALDYYQKLLTMSEKLDSAGGAGSEWQRSLAVSLERIGDLQKDGGDIAAAIAMFERELTVYQRITDEHPDDVASQIASAVPHMRLAALQDAKKVSHLEDALAILKPLDGDGKLDAEHQEWVTSIESDLRDTKAMQAVARLQASVKAASDTKDYAKAAVFQIELAQTQERYETDRDGKPGAATAAALSDAAWFQILSNQFEDALTNATRAVELQPDAVIDAINYAHALMLSGQEEDARSAYMKYKGERTAEGRGLWEEEILNDFSDLDQAGLKHPLMDEIRVAFADTAMQSTNTKWLRDLSLSYERLGDGRSAAGDRKAGTGYYWKSLAAMLKLAKSDEGQPEWRRNLAASLDHVGGPLAEGGAVPSAIQAFEAELAICQQLAAKQPSDVQSLLMSATAHVRLADLKEGERGKHLDAALAILKPLAAEGKLDAEHAKLIAGIEEKILQSNGFPVGQTQAAVQAAFEAKDYAKAANLQAELVKVIEKAETAQGGKAGAKTEAALLAASWYQLFARQFDAALASSGRAMELHPDAPIDMTNRAHALMFLGKADEARALYLKYKGQRIAEGRGLWEEEILNDFAQLEAAGLNNPLMDEIRTAFGATLEQSSNVEWLRALAQSLGKAGDARKAAGDRQAAAGIYKKLLAVAGRLDQLSQERADWQGEIAVNLTRLGNSFSETGENASAIEAFERASVIYRRLIQRHPEDLQAKVFYVVPELRLADLKQSEKISHLETVLATLKPLAAEGRLDAQRLEWLAKTELKLRDAKALQTLLPAQAAVQAASDAKDYAKAAALQAELAKSVEKVEIERNGKAGPMTASTLMGLSWYQLLARQFDAALASSSRSMELQPDAVINAVNNAHALMFAGRLDEARAAYLKHKGQPVAEGRGLWEQEVLNDFSALEQDGLKRPLMDEIRAALSPAAERK